MHERIPTIGTLPTSYSHLQLGFLSFSTECALTPKYSSFVNLTPKEPGNDKSLLVNFPMNLVTLVADLKAKSHFSFDQFLQALKSIVPRETLEATVVFYRPARVKLEKVYDLQPCSKIALFDFEQ
eukprot:TRINITY_DN14117_c0_g1_i1.p1 TRINITY_DN14117_c0_g1~~TRINITY_DN14117_c0_g1_i1.p1  ORF type:complete len:125 (-),score=10.86 TRINITY_DN14117_c0_g1_i1:20-394(-)